MVEQTIVQDGVEIPNPTLPEYIRADVAKRLVTERGLYIRQDETSAGVLRLEEQSRTPEQRFGKTTIREKEYPGIYERRPAYAGPGPERDPGVPTSYIVVDGRKVYEGTEEFGRLTGEPTVEQIIESRMEAEPKAETAPKSGMLTAIPR